MTGMRETWLVAGREITERLRGRAIWILTAFTTLLVVLAIVIPAVVQPSQKPARVGLVGPAAQSLAPSLRRIAGEAHVGLRVGVIASPATARAELGQGRLDVALVVGGDTAEAMVQRTLSPPVGAVLQAAVNADHQALVLHEAGVPPQTIGRALTPVRFTTMALNPVPPDRAARSLAAIAAAILLWVSVGAYGGVVANGVAQEKTSRTAEVLLASLAPRQLLVGKVAGIGLCGLGQMGVTVVGGLIANAVVHQTEIPATLWVLLPAVLLWFLLGYALYSLAFAVAGALVSRQEEVQLVTMPFAVFLLGGYVLTYAAIATPNSAWVRGLSFVPPLAPVLMPARIALGHVAIWEIPVAVVITLAAIAATARLAARIYAGALMRSGPRLGWRAALRLPR